MLTAFTNSFGSTLHFAQTIACTAQFWHHEVYLHAPDHMSTALKGHRESPDTLRNARNLYFDNTSLPGTLHGKDFRLFQYNHRIRRILYIHIRYSEARIWNLS